MLLAVLCRSLSLFPLVGFILAVILLGGFVGYPIGADGDVLWAAMFFAPGYTIDDLLDNPCRMNK